MANPSLVYLRVSEGGKEIPYRPAVRPEGSICHGFKMLKGALEDDIRATDEASDTECLAEAIVAINHAETAFFTVGCEKAFNTAADGFWAKGYLEFSSNYVEIVVDAANYFPLFFHFNKFLSQRGYSDPVLFDWELLGATFVDAKVKGFTVTVWIQTATLSTEDEVKAAWCRAVALLAEYLCGQSYHADTPIYASRPRR